MTTLVRTHSTEGRSTSTKLHGHVDAVPQTLANAACRLQTPLGVGAYIPHSPRLILLASYGLSCQAASLARAALADASPRLAKAIIKQPRENSWFVYLDTLLPHV